MRDRCCTQNTIVCSFLAHFRSFEKQLEPRASARGVHQNRLKLGDRRVI